MDMFGWLLVLICAVLWGATDALIKKVSPPQIKKDIKVRQKGGLIERGKNHIKKLTQDFVALILCPGYLMCQVGHFFENLICYM